MEPFDFGHGFGKVFVPMKIRLIGESRYAPLTGHGIDILKFRFNFGLLIRGQGRESLKNGLDLRLLERVKVDFLQHAALFMEIPCQQGIRNLAEKMSMRVLVGH
ncbi:MAG: hypothetical protein IIA62_07445 [Nitrospinae bacterium]|nr:hypothetical protein [Nitrospinota bacterium]